MENDKINTENSYIPQSERPKLFKQMLDIPYELSPLNMDELFKYLNNHKVKGTICFKFYAEFLNLINSVVFYYYIGFYSIKTSSLDPVIFAFVDLSFIFSAFIYYFLIKNKHIPPNSRYIPIFSAFGLWLSKTISLWTICNDTPVTTSILNYVKLNYFVFSIPLFGTYDYFISPISTSSMATKILYTILAFLISNIDTRLLAKLRFFLQAINLFEFIPEIRKLVSSYSEKHYKIAYAVNSCIICLLLLHIEEYYILALMIIGNCSFIVIYPLIFNYYYRLHKQPIKGLWDCAKVTSYY